MSDNTPPAWVLAAAKRARDEAPNAPEATVRAVEYAVNCVPEDYIDSNVFQVRVQYRGGDRYAVISGGEMCLGADGTWDYGLNESGRGDAWLNAHRFDLDTALRLAKEQAPLITVNGNTVTDAIAMQAKRAARDA
ncbi:hypothetical protein ABZ404_37135 [Streptomyces sp. NPDC005878]|uniref:hypothetical protein n=1 Tax=Streptomyces sp. NPDC005878 TaxID=3157077 RepID=UPI0033F24876